MKRQDQRNSNQFIPVRRFWKKGKNVLKNQEKKDGNEKHPKTKTSGKP